MTEDLGTAAAVQSAATSGRYLFAFTRGLETTALAGVVGLSGAPVELVDHESLQAVVCTVDLDEYGEDALTRNLEDLAWLEALARTHNAVVFRAAEVATVAPARLATICSDDASVRARIADAHDALVSALDRVQGRVEMSVKVHATSAMTDGSGADEPATADGPGAGAAYLHRKKLQAQHRREAGDRAARTAEDIDRALGACAVAGRRLAPQDPRLTGRPDPMVLNAAYLVEDSAVDEVRDLADRLRSEHPGALIEVEGPWPPYSFATLEAP